MLPEALAALGDLANNLRWSWHPPTQDVFAEVDPKLWESTGCDGVNFILNSHNVLPQQEVLDSLRLFAAEVMPHFDPLARGRKEAALAGQR